MDLFGGSGLLAHVTKCERPDALVVYNDYDNYRERLENIPRTNALIADLRAIASNYEDKVRLPLPAESELLERILQEERAGFVDYITLSANLLFSGKTATTFAELKDLRPFYNKIRKSDYDVASNYLDGIEVVSCDYKELFERFKDNPNVVFLVDPPYLSTEVGSYTMSWKLADYLDVLLVLQESAYVYFTSNKSDIIELCEWIGTHKVRENPFKDATRVDFRAGVNFNSRYTDIMLYRQTA